MEDCNHETEMDPSQSTSLDSMPGKGFPRNVVRQHALGLPQPNFPTALSKLESLYHYSHESKGAQTGNLALGLSLGSYHLQSQSVTRPVTAVDTLETSSELSRNFVEHSSGSITEIKDQNGVVGAGSSAASAVSFNSNIGTDWGCVSDCFLSESSRRPPQICNVDMSTTFVRDLALHGADEKVYPCRFCDRRFYSSQALGGHQNAHKRERLVARKGPKYTLPYVGNVFPALHGSVGIISEPSNINRSLGIKAHSLIHKPAISALDYFRGQIPQAHHGWSRALIGQQPSVARCLPSDPSSKLMVGGVARFEGPAGFGGKICSGIMTFEDDDGNWDVGTNRNCKHLCATNLVDFQPSQQRQAPCVSPASSLVLPECEDVGTMDLSLRL